MIGGSGGQVGPNLDRPTLEADILARLSDPEYAQRVAELDRLDREPYAAYRRARQQVLAAPPEQRARVWMKYHLLEPKFDNQLAQMPNLGLSDAEGAAVADHLLHRDTMAPDKQGDSRAFANGCWRGCRPPWWSGDTSTSRSWRAS